MSTKNILFLHFPYFSNKNCIQIITKMIIFSVFYKYFKKFFI